MSRPWGQFLGLHIACTLVYALTATLGDYWLVQLWQPNAVAIPIVVALPLSFVALRVRKERRWKP